MMHSKAGFFIFLCILLSACDGRSVSLVPQAEAESETAGIDTPQSSESNGTDPQQNENIEAQPVTSLTQDNAAASQPAVDTSTNENANSEPVAVILQPVVDNPQPPAVENSDPEPVADVVATQPVAETPSIADATDSPAAVAPATSEATTSPIAEAVAPDDTTIPTGPEAPSPDEGTPQPVADTQSTEEGVNNQPATDTPSTDEASLPPPADLPSNDDVEPIVDAPLNDGVEPEPSGDDPRVDDVEAQPIVEVQPTDESPAIDDTNLNPAADLPQSDGTSTFPSIETVNEVVEAELKYQNILGAAIAVIQNGEITHAKGYGFTTLEMDNPVSTETVFRWASISKTITAISALQVDESTDNFSIDDNVSAHVDYWPSDSSNKSNVTIKHLLSHRSGVIHYRNTGNCPENQNPDFDREAHGDVSFNAQDAVSVFADQSLCFTPGNRFRYSTFGFSLAAAAIEKEAGRSYAEWVQANIASPLAMNSLTQGTGISRGYKGDGGDCNSLTRVSEPSKSYVLPGGGWASNIVDLARFANGIIQGTLLDNTERLWSESTGNSNTYRLGIDLSSDGQRAWHTGGHGDLRTFMELYLTSGNKTGIVVYLNNPYSDPQRMSRRVANALGISSWSIPLNAGCQ